jgi:hypothetical protein
VKHLRIETLLFQGNIVTTDFFAQGGINQIILELRNQKLFDSILKIDYLKDDGVETVYTNDILVNLVAECRIEYEAQKGNDDEQN